ncbi:GH25 family lysozyme [Paenibacillus sp. OV219]|uniref:GH25 family lysozyme n=1 Tax=Paenibacillus sp. OV219 TaxID=1884377 RepID=UPI0008CE99BD|nr:GH25 family lysozyme [Paenibacillus sp. OV219]SEO60588.1 lysozyme [Paenibacillus sp. OV219]
MQARGSAHIKIIDVSHHQDEIDWVKVSASGIAGAFIKATDGRLGVDSNFSRNATAARAAGLPIGFYHYAHPEVNNAIAEAKHFAEVVKEYESQFPHVLDVEGDASKIKSAELTKWCITWFTEVQRLTSHPVMIYTSASFARSNLGKDLGRWPLWIAHYGVLTPMDNHIWSTWAVFQYTSSGRINGINGNVDLDAMEQSFFEKYAVKAVEAPIAVGPQPINPLDTVKVAVDGKTIAFGRIIDSQAYVPLRQLGDALQVTVRWDAAAATPYVDGKPITNFKLVSGKTYISLRAAVEALGGKVTWDKDMRQLDVYK